MENYLVLIDGPKGAGKTTLAELLKKNLLNTEFFRLDNERKLLERTNSIDNDNERAFQVIFEKLNRTFQQNKNVVLDSGLSEKRIGLLEHISNENNIKVYKFALIAPYDVLHSRVLNRDESKGKDFNKERFDYTFNANQSKSFDGFSILDSSKLSPQEILDIVCSEIMN